MRTQSANSYQDLLVWQKAMDLAESCYHLTNLLPREELYGLSSQIRRAAVSVPSNIAEGYGRGSRKSYVHFLYIAQGSLKEIETDVILTRRLHLIENDVADQILSQCSEIGRILGAMIRKLMKDEKEH